MKRALIIQPGAVGDMLLTLPLINYILDQNLADQVDVMGHLDRLSYLLDRARIERVMSIDEVPLHKLFVPHIDFSIGEKDELVWMLSDYDLIVSFMHDESGDFAQNLVASVFMRHRADVVTIQLHPEDDYLDHVGRYYIEQFNAQMPCLDEISLGEVLDKTFLTSTMLHVEGARLFASQQSVKLPEDRLVVLHPGSGALRKCGPLNGFIALTDLLIEKSYAPVVITGPAERDLWSSEVFCELDNALNMRSVPLIRELSLNEAANMIISADGYIGHDSGLSHLAAMLGRRTVCMFGRSNPTHWHPLGRKTAILSPDHAEVTAKHVLYNEVKWPTPQLMVETFEAI